ncbi:formate dehydrogenase accessory protein FdhE [Desulfitobacterium chlororespirans]|uniref:formate dehydrogenase accessory protein FdhE domain-containing protein n=1 Tax=Desulfitobacterium chlororespirans TaxID=51616 RepID=UPI000A05BDD2|nr:formate dehydrogenase accessory protein FdhE [Desulfitobacterium chlororespirans]
MIRSAAGPGAGLGLRVGGRLPIGGNVVRKNILTTEQEEQHLVAVKDNYLKLQGEIKLWQQEHASSLAADFQLKPASPRFTLDNLPEESIIDLWQRLNQVADEPQEKADLRTLLEQFKQGDPLDNPAAARLQLALAGVAQMLCQHLVPKPGEDNQPFGTCPVCGEKHFMTLLAPPVGKRYQQCLVCGYQRPVDASGCACCGSMDAKKQTYLKSEQYPGMEVAVCADCGSYFKQVDLRELSVDDLVWEDIRTMPLNYAAEKWLAGQHGWN